MQKIFQSIRAAVEHKLSKIPRQIDIPTNTTAEVASFFIDMEKLFGSESIINELEEDDSDLDEEQYNKNFMNDLNREETKYASNRVRHSPGSYKPGFKKSRSKFGSNGRVRPFNDLGKVKQPYSKEFNQKSRPKYSPYTGSEKGFGISGGMKKNKCAQSQKKMGNNFSVIKKSCINSQNPLCPHSPQTPSRT